MTYKRTRLDGGYDGKEQTVKRRALSSGSSFSNSPVSIYQDSSSNTRETSNGIDRLSDDLDLLDPLGSSSSPLTPSSVTSPINYESSSIKSSVSGDVATRPEFCFGMIVDASLAPPLGRSAATPKELFTSPDSQIALSFRIRADAITILLPAREECGVLDLRTARVLRVLITGDPSLEFEAFVDADQVEGTLQRTKPFSTLPLCINVYGSISSMDKVASVLSENGYFLQEPVHVCSTSTYFNPHFLSWEEDSKTPQLRQFLPHRVDMEAGVQEILDPSNTLKGSDCPRQDDRILTALHNHQLEAVQFMITREDEYIGDETLSLWRRQWRLDRNIFVHTVTKAEQYTKPPEARGGILADEMGTGKTLTLLAVVVHTLDEARLQRYRSSDNQVQSRARLCSGATLIIAPKSTLYNWESEVNKHISTGSVMLYLYHGTRTSADSKLLEESDIVLTTYETASLDYFKDGVLSRIHWFRIVLDEAHHIRNRSTKTFRAIKGLQAQRRWCLTGTPVQNKLEDLFSLTEFLRFYPVDSYSNARQYILNPLGRKDQHVLTYLRSIMTTVALRRAKAACQIRRRSEIQELVILSSDEREQYDRILFHAKKMRSKSTRDAPAQVLFRSIIKLRQICSHGKLNHPPETRSDCQTRGQSSNCRNCGDSLPRSPMPIEADQDIQGGQLCYDCALSWNDIATDLSPHHSLLDVDAEISENEDVEMDVYRDESPLLKAEKSSKLEKVFSNLFKRQRVFNDDRTPVKSLVFSCWTTTLTCLGRMLEDQKMSFVRIDGSQSLDERAKNINRFQSDPDLRIMLPSTGCGSVGLNLTAASYVDILEPQWNPIVEAQAAARVDRLDQNKDVVVIRYVVEHSIEERIRARQKKKILNAEFSASQMSTDEMSDMPDDLRSLEDLL